MVESIKLSTEKAFHTALCILPPKEILDQIQVIREKYDSAFKRWPPHINMSFPFVPPSEFPIVKQLLQETLNEIPCFKVEFKQFNYFNHGKKSVLWVQPDTAGYFLSLKIYVDNGKEIVNLENQIIKTIPFLDDLLKKSETGIFIPHLTLGQFSSSSIEKEKQKLENTFKKVEYIVEELSLIQRDGKDSPFYVVDTIKLKK